MKKSLLSFVTDSHVLADGNRVMWVIGYRISDYKIDEATKRHFRQNFPTVRKGSCLQS